VNRRLGAASARVRRLRDAASECAPRAPGVAATGRHDAKHTGTLFPSPRRHHLAFRFRFRYVLHPFAAKYSQVTGSRIITYVHAYSE
jgi:hypothetical protein